MSEVCLAQRRGEEGGGEGEEGVEKPKGPKGCGNKTQPPSASGKWIIAYSV